MQDKSGKREPTIDYYNEFCHVHCMITEEALRAYTVCRGVENLADKALASIKFYKSLDPFYLF